MKSDSPCELEMIGKDVVEDSVAICGCGCGCGDGCSCGCGDSRNLGLCGCEKCGPSCNCEAVNEKQEDIKIPIQPETCEEAAKFDLAADRARWEKDSLWCYGVSIALLCLLLTMIAVWPPLRYFSPSSIQYPSSAKRVHYISAEYVEWTFTNGDNKCYANGFGGPGPDNTPGSDLSTINGTFRKAVFRAYSDVYFNRPLAMDPRWEHLGLLGPTILAEAGDTIDIFFMNKLDFPLNTEPAGSDWSPVAGLLPSVVPGRVISFSWLVPESASPSPQDEQNSRLFFYRSTISPTRHENAGLSGPIIITRKGEARADGSSIDVDRDIVTVFEVFNENETPSSQVNLGNKLNNGTVFFRMGINGYSWCNIPGLSFKYGERVRWHIAALGSEEGLHSFHWHGNVLSVGGMRMDEFQMGPGGTLTTDLTPDNVGAWLFHCHVNEHLNGGMVAVYTVLPPTDPTVKPLTFLNESETIDILGGVVREVFVQAEEVDWDYAPLNGSTCGPAFGTSAEPWLPFEPGSPLFAAGNGTLSLGRKIKKAMFVKYQDSSYSIRTPRDPSEAYLGILGPTLRANVGDTIIIHYRNQLSSSPTSMHPHGVFYLKGSEGAPYRDGTHAMVDTGDDLVPPGGSWRYVWHVPERAGPGKNDISTSIMWMYHSHAHESMDTNAGLFGAIIIYPRPSNLTSDLAALNRPSDVNKEVVLFLSNMEESDSIFTQANIESLLASEMSDQGLSVEEVVVDAEFISLNQRPSINGFMFCNLPLLELTAGKVTRFHLMTLGAQLDMHSPSIDSASLYELGHHRHSSSLQMSSGSMLTLNLKPQAQGTWRIFDGVQNHAFAGMMATYNVVGVNTSSIPSNPVNKTTERVFYIAAEVVDWDYAPDYETTTAIMCTQANYTARADTYLLTTPGATIGHRSLKARYVQYEDASFTRASPQPKWWGIQGPLILAEVGDVITVVLRNSLPSDSQDSGSNLGRPLNLRPLAPLLAILNANSSSLSLLSDQGSSGYAPSIAPGETITYRWLVPEEAGPPLDPIQQGYIEHTASYTYSSSIDPTGDENLGLVGGLVIGCRGCIDWSMGNGRGAPRGMDRIEPVLWQVFDENLSPFLQANIERSGVNVSSWPGGLEDENFMESNMRHAINGFMYCAMPPITFALGERVRWVVLDYGAATALHVPYFEGQLLQTHTGPTSSILMMPGQAFEVDMTASRVGSWPMYCQVHDHLEAGMMGAINVTK